MDETSPNLSVGTSNAENQIITEQKAPLSEKKEVTTGDIDSYRRELKSIKEDAEKTKKMMGRIENITYLGFLIIILMVVSLVFSYIEFIYSGSKNDDYKYNLLEKVSENKNQIDNLKLCLDNSRWFNPKCFGN